MRKIMSALCMTLCIYAHVLYALKPQEFVKKYIDTYKQKYGQQYATLYSQIQLAFDTADTSRIEQLLGGLKSLAQEEKAYLLKIESEYRRLKKSPVNPAKRELAPLTTLYNEQVDTGTLRTQIVQSLPFMSPQTQVDLLLRPHVENFDQWLKKRHQYQKTVNQYIAETEKRLAEMQQKSAPQGAVRPPTPPSFLMPPVMPHMPQPSAYAPQGAVYPAVPGVVLTEPGSIPRGRTQPVPPAFLTASQPSLKKPVCPTMPQFLMPKPPVPPAPPKQMPPPPAFLTHPQAE